MVVVVVGGPVVLVLETAGDGLDFPEPGRESALLKTDPTLGDVAPDSLFDDEDEEESRPKPPVLLLGVDDAGPDEPVIAGIILELGTG